MCLLLFPEQQRRREASLIRLLALFSVACLTPFGTRACAHPPAFAKGIVSAMARKRRGGGISASRKNSPRMKTANSDMKKEKENSGAVGVSGSSSGCQQTRRSWLAFAGVVLIAAISALIALSVGRIGGNEEGKGGSDGEAMGKEEVATSGSDDTSNKPFDVENVFVGAKYEVVEVIPHDPDAFTQGLTYFGGVLYEGTGLYGESQLRKLKPEDGSVIQSHSMDRKHFGEGIAHFKDKSGAERIIQLTWKEKAGFLYDAKTFEVLKEFTYHTTTSEGWGITFNADTNEFIVSDGSSWLFFWDAETLEEKRRIEVKVPRADESGHINWHPVRYLNELEWVRDRIIANVWYQDVLLTINHRTGHVEKVYDFSHLYKNRQAGADCFNGISVSGVDGELYVTGKKWPHLYRIKLLD